MSQSSPCVPLKRQELKEAVAHNLAEHQNIVSDDVKTLDHKFGLYKATFEFCTLVPHTSNRGQDDPFRNDPYISDEVKWTQDWSIKYAGGIPYQARYYTTTYKFGTKMFYVFFHQQCYTSKGIPTEFNPSEGFPDDRKLFYGFVTRRFTVLDNIKGFFQDGQSGQLFFVVNPPGYKIYQCRYLKLLDESDFSFKRVYGYLEKLKKEFLTKISYYKKKLEDYAKENGIDMSRLSELDIVKLAKRVCSPLKQAMLDLVKEYRDKLLFETIAPVIVTFLQNILEHLALELIISTVVIPFPLGLVHSAVSKVTDRYLEKEVSKLVNGFTILSLDFMQFNYNTFVGDYLRKAHTI